MLLGTLDCINSYENVLLDTNNYKNERTKTLKEFTSEAKNIINNPRGTCATFLKNTLPDQSQPKDFWGIPKIRKLTKVIKTVMQCISIIDENLSDQSVIDIAIEPNILPPFRPIISGIGCLTYNMSAYVDKILHPFPKFIFWLHPRHHPIP